MVRALIFDIDGTLLDWDASMERALRGVLPELPRAYRDGLAERLGGAVADWAHVLRDGVVVDRKYWMFFLDPVPPWRAALPGADGELVERTAQRFASLLEPVPYADAAPALEALRGRYVLGVLSNSPRAEETVAHLGLLDHFDAVLALVSDDERKPNPQAFLRSCRELGVAPAEAAYVGDSPVNDVEGALAAGLVPVWIDRYRDGYRLPEGAHRIESLAELSGLLAALAPEERG